MHDMIMMSMKASSKIVKFMAHWIKGSGPKMGPKWHIVEMN